MKKVVWGTLFIGLIVIQFFKPVKNISKEDYPSNITTHYETSPSVQYILTNACYDCHSNNSSYPWYSKVQPFAWFLANHINNGKKKLNFDEFYDYPLKKQDHKLEELTEVIRENEMPLKSYTILHEEARLTENQKQLLIDWANSIRDQINVKSQ